MVSRGLLVRPEFFESSPDVAQIRLQMRSLDNGMLCVPAKYPVTLGDDCAGLFIAAISLHR